MFEPIGDLVVKCNDSEEPTITSEDSKSIFLCEHHRKCPETDDKIRQKGHVGEDRIHWMHSMVHNLKFRVDIFEDCEAHDDAQEYDVKRLVLIFLVAILHQVLPDVIFGQVKGDHDLEDKNRQSHLIINGLPNTQIHLSFITIIEPVGEIHHI